MSAVDAGNFSLDAYRLLLATGNARKVRELRAILEESGWTAVTAAAADISEGQRVPISRASSSIRIQIAQALARSEGVSSAGTNLATTLPRYVTVKDSFSSRTCRNISLARCLSSWMPSMHREGLPILPMTAWGAWRAASW